MLKENQQNKRPRYETEEHLQQERAFADTLANKWSTFTFEKADISTGFDYWVYDDNRKVRAICEIKCRNTFYTSYVSVMISKKKFEKIKTMCDMFGFEDGGNHITLKPIYGLFAFRFLDADYYFRYEKNEFEKQVADKNIWEEVGGGRTKQTRDRWDKEDMIHIAREILIPIDVKFKSGVVHGRRSRKFCEYQKKDYEIKG